MIKTSVLNDTQRCGVLRHIMISLRYLLPAIAVFYILLYLFVAISRMGYPYELEWMEGRALEHVIRILEGKSIYPSPSLSFVPLSYTPLYFFISALVSILTGSGFFALRLVSFLSFLGILLMTFIFIRKETTNGYAGLIGAGFFAATFRISGSWFDIARVDSLFVLLLLLGIYFIRFGKSYKSMVMAAVFITGSFFTKQSAFVVTIPLAIYLLFINWRHFLVYIISFIILCLGISILLDTSYNGWYNLYTIILPYALSKYFVLAKLKPYLVHNLLLPLNIALAGSAWFVLSRLFYRQYTVFFFYFCLMIGFIVGVLPSFFNVGGYLNDLIPGHLAISVLFALAVYYLINGLKNNINTMSRILIIIIYALAIFQFGILAYNPLKMIPSQNDKKAGDELVSLIKSFDGDVFIPSHPYLAVRAGKSYYMHISALNGYLLLTGNMPGAKEKPDMDIYAPFVKLYTLNNDVANLDFSRQLIGKITHRQFGAIILDSDKFPFDLEPYYYYAGKIFKDDVFWTFTGVHTRPNLLYLPTQGTGD